MNKRFLPTFLMTCVWLAAPVVLAQSTDQAAAKKALLAKTQPSANRTDMKSTVSPMPASIMAAEVALEPMDLAIAEQVHTGVLRCELGVSVTLAHDPHAPGYFNVQGKNFRYRMRPIATTTGAIRLEDRKAGTVWLQLSNKSMLMNQKVGQRLADECMSPAQLTVTQAMRDKPVPGLLD